MYDIEFVRSGSKLQLEILYRVNAVFNSASEAVAHGLKLWGKPGTEHADRFRILENGHEIICYQTREDSEYVNRISNEPIRSQSSQI